MPDLHKDFLKQFTAVHQSIYAYVRSAGFTLTDTDDVMQDVAVALWESFGAYDASRPFVGWAFGVTRNVIRKRFRHMKVRQRVVVSSELSEKIADQVAVTLAEHEPALAREKECMEQCLHTLPPNARELLRMKYEQRMSLADIAAKLGKSYAAANMLLTRLRARLLDCISIRMRESAS
ncbi:MAG: sigma-70 family RNA polymerase sigma factor [Kiritimatiellae bacterium]|nr:sigma-70 family RNA polymerase sigma factor [Kiritimatiellia bacterium]